MKAANIIKANEIPVKQLESVGLNEKMLFGLHPKELERMMRGRLSPLMADLKVKDDMNRAMSFSGKIRFVRTEGGNVELMVYPARKELKNDFNLSPEDFNKLKDGKAVLVTLEQDYGEEKVFLQCDKETNVVMSMKQGDVRVPQAIGDIVLGEEQRERYLEGKPIELKKDDTTVTVGVDLDDPTGCRVIKGDMNMWQQKKLEEWDKRTPDAYGYWQTTENGLQYKSFVEKQKGISQENTEQQEQRSGYGRRR